MRVVFTVGLPASGKSTWARAFCEKNTDWIRVSRDDLRNMRGKYWIFKQENLITKFENSCIVEALRDNKNVIIDATNLCKDRCRHRVLMLRDEFPDLDVEYNVFDIEVGEAIKRDLTRANSVGADAIQGMYDKYLAPEPVIYTEDESLPKAVIFDVDGTLAQMVDRSPFEWMRVLEDLPKTEVIKLTQMYKTAGYKVIIFTGRDGVCLELTKKWLTKFEVPFDDVFIRPEGNQEKDSIIKKRLFEENIRGKYFVDLIVDDRDQVVKMWRQELGLTCLQVDYGNF